MHNVWRKEEKLGGSTVATKAKTMQVKGKKGLTVKVWALMHALVNYSIKQLQNKNKGKQAYRLKQQSLTKAPLAYTYTLQPQLETQTVE